jgi:hypothetical protein
LDGNAAKRTAKKKFGRRKSVSATGMSADVEHQLANAKIAISESLECVERMRRIFADLEDDDFDGSVGRVRALLAAIEERLQLRVADRDRGGMESGKVAPASKPRSP